MSAVRLIVIFFVSVFFSINSYADINCISDDPQNPLINSNVDKYRSFHEVNGVPRLALPNGEYIKYPVQYTQVAVGYYNNYIETGSKESRDKFLVLASFIKDEFQKRKGWGGWFTESTLPGVGYNLSPGWISSMSQGFGISAMLGAYFVTSNDEYKEIADMAVSAFGVPAVKGGLYSKFGGYAWYDEYPTFPEKHVLNGFVFALSGLHDYYCSTGDKESLRYLRDGIESLKMNISRFDAGFASYYSQSANINTSHGLATVTGDRYQAIHATQMLWLHSITEDRIFYNFANRFAAQDFGELSQSHDIDPKFKTIIANHTIEPQQYGTSNLDDSIINYGKYWSSNKFPASIKAELTRPVKGLKTIVLVSTGELLEEVSFYGINEQGKFPLKFELDDIMRIQERQHESLIHSYTIVPPSSSVAGIAVVIPKQKSGIVRLREINAMYNMSPELKRLSKSLGY